MMDRHPKGRIARPPAWLEPVAQKLELTRMDSPGVNMFGVVYPAGPDEADDLNRQWKEDPIAGAIFGHWVAIKRAEKKGHGKGHPVYMCVSKCGSIVRMTGKLLAAGLAPAECVKCMTVKRDGPAPIGSVFTTEKKHISQLWEAGVATIINETSSIEGRPATAEWESMCRQILTDLLADTTMGKHHAWKAHIRQCHHTPQKRGEENVHVQRVADGVNRVELRMHAKDGVYTFDVSLSTARTDIQFKDWASEVIQAIGRRSGRTEVVVSKIVTPMNGKHPEPAALVPVASDSTSVPGAIDIAKLVSLRGGIDKVLAVGKDLNDIAAMKGPAQAALARAREVAAATDGAVRFASEGHAVAADKLGVQKERAADLERRLGNARADVENAQNELNRAALALASAKKDHEPAALELEKAVKELREIEALEVDRLKVVGEAKGLAALLQALGQIGV